MKFWEMFKKTLMKSTIFEKNFLKFSEIHANLVRKLYINVIYSCKSTNFSPKISSIEAFRVKFIKNFKKYLGYSPNNYIGFFSTLFLHKIKNAPDHNQLKNYVKRERENSRRGGTWVDPYTTGVRWKDPVHSGPFRSRWLPHNWFLENGQ